MTTAYQLTETDPARVREVVEAKGKSCGASLLNDEFRKLLEARLEGATNRLDIPWSKIIDSAVIGWENGHKRKIDVTQRNNVIDDIYIPGLEKNDDLRIGSNRVRVKYREMKDVFKECLRKVAELMREQLQQAKEARDGDSEARGFAVQKVILIGGFGGSPSLRNHLENVLTTELNLLGQPIELIPSRYIDSAVARGAVLRALNKENGPTRISRTSYGVMRDDVFDPDNPIHRRLKWQRDPADGVAYIRDTLHWQISKVRNYGNRLFGVAC